VETLFLACAATGGTVLLLQFLAGLIGFGADHSFDHDHDLGHDSDHGDGTSWFAGLITLRSVTAGLTFFGLSGLTALSQGLDEPTALAAAVGGGALALAGVAEVMKGLKRLADDGTVQIERAVGKPGVVYIPVPGGNSGPGKVTVTVQKRSVQYAAYTAAEGLPTGARVRVVGVRGPSAVDVEPIPAQAAV
jgi:hypothetical protein